MPSSPESQADLLKEKLSHVSNAPSPASPASHTNIKKLLRLILIFFFGTIFLYYLTSNNYIPKFSFPFKMPTKNPPFKPQEIADLMTQYYELLADMTYYPRSYIKYPPHNPAVSLELCEKYKLEPQVIELLQLLPYVEGYNNEDEFILYGSFADYRDEGVFEQSRDPTYASPEGGFEEWNGEYMRPWVIALTECGNHGTVVYLDTHTG